MPRYYFHLEKSGNRTGVDDDVADLPDAEAAWYHAYRWFADFLQPSEDRSDAVLEVEDETGTPVFVLTVEDLPLALA